MPGKHLGCTRQAYPLGRMSNLQRKKSKCVKLKVGDRPFAFYGKAGVPTSDEKKYLQGKVIDLNHPCSQKKPTIPECSVYYHPLKAQSELLPVPPTSSPIVSF